MNFEEELFYIILNLSFFLFLKFNSIIPNIKPLGCLEKIDKKIYGFSYKDFISVLKTYFKQIFLDIFLFFPYLYHFILPFHFITYLHIYEKENTIYFYKIFFLTNWLTLILQKIIPTKPPWYIEMENQPSKINKKSNYYMVGDLKRVDDLFEKLFNIRIFQKIYSNSTWIYGSFPSLHTSWVFIIFLVQKESWLFQSFNVINIIWISISAIYYKHHFIIDILGALIIPIISKILVQLFW